MGSTIRFGVSLDDDLLEKFDALCQELGYTSRSEALRDLIREKLAENALQLENTEAAGVLTLLYNHHLPDLSRKLTDIQHDSHKTVVATLHVHLDHDHCLEALVLRGSTGELKKLADHLRAIRGVTHASFAITPTTNGSLD